MNQMISQSSQSDLESLTALCLRADRHEGRISLSISVPKLPEITFSELLYMGTERGANNLLAEVQAHPLYRSIVEKVPRVATLRGASQFDPLRRTRVIAECMSNPMPGKVRQRSGRPDKKRQSVRRAILRLQKLTSSPLRKRILAEWAVEDLRSRQVKFGSIAHLAVWHLAFNLWIHADTADVRLLLGAASLVDPAGIDDSTARRYISQARKLVPRHPRTILHPSNLPRVQKQEPVGLLELIARGPDKKA